MENKRYVVAGSLLLFSFILTAILLEYSRIGYYDEWYDELSKSLSEHTQRVSEWWADSPEKAASLRDRPPLLSQK